MGAEAGRTREVLAATLVGGVALAVAAAFLAILADLAVHGGPAIDLGFLTAPVEDAGRAGGIGPVLVSTGLILGVCFAAVLPLGLGTAILLAEYGGAGPWTGRIRFSLEVLAGVPSVVFGLFGAVFFCRVLGLGFSIVAGGLTLACMALPILIRATEEGLRAVPDDQRYAAAALGLSRTRTLREILLPAATPGLAAGLALGIGRALAETAALLFTSGYVPRMPASLWDSGRALSIHVYDLAMNVPGGNAHAYASALVLVVVLLVVQGGAARLLERTLGGEATR